MQFFRIFQPHLFAQLLVREQLIKDMIVPLSLDLVHNPCLFQKIIRNTRSRDVSIMKLNLNKLSKSARVIIPQRPCVSKTLQQWVGRQNLFF